MISTDIYENIELIESSGKKLSGIKVGTGPIPCVFMPTGSFQLGRISVNLKKNVFTFYVFEDYWTIEKPTFENEEKYEEFKKIQDEKVRNINFKDLVAKMGELINLLKKEFDYSKVALMGFSAPALIALQAAIDFSQDVAMVIGQGAPTEFTDGKFEAAKIYFDTFAEPERREEFTKDIENFLKQEEVLFDSNYFDKKKKRLTPNSTWTEGAKAFFSRQYYHFKDPQKKVAYAKSWRFALDGKVLNQSMRNHFFDNLLVTIKPEEILEEVCKTTVPVILVTGKDYTIKPPVDTMKLKLGASKNVEVVEFEESVHYPSDDEPKRFDSEIIKFIEKNDIGVQFEKSSSLGKTI